MDTNRLVLRPMVADDFHDLLEIFADPLVMTAFLRGPFSQEEMQAWLTRNLQHQEEHGFGLFSVIEKELGKLVGNCGLEVMEDEAGEVCELGFDFRSDRWGRGYATEAALAVISYAFEELGQERLISLIRVGNEASRRVAAKVGMTMKTEIERPWGSYWVYELRRPSHFPLGTPGFDDAQ